jgi:hypothetical protein
VVCACHVSARRGCSACIGGREACLHACTLRVCRHFFDTCVCGAPLLRRRGARRVRGARSLLLGLAARAARAYNAAQESEESERGRCGHSASGF